MNSARVFVAKMPPKVTESELREYFSEFGEVTDAYMPKDRSRQHYRGIGFVHFRDRVVAKKVVSGRHRFHGHTVIVEFATPRSVDKRAASLDGYGSEQDATSAMLHDLVKCTVDNDDGKETEAQDGNANNGSGTLTVDPLIAPPPLNVDTKWMIPAAMGAPGEQERNNAILENEQYTNATKVLLQVLEVLSLTFLPPLTPNSNFGDTAKSQTNMMKPSDPPAVTPVKTVEKAPTQMPSCHSPSSEKESPRNQRSKPRVYVGRLPPDCKECDLKLCFAIFGEVADVFLPRSRSDKSRHRGFGFVSFHSSDSIERIAAHGPPKFRGSPLSLDIAIPEGSAAT